MLWCAISPYSAVGVCGWGFAWIPGEVGVVPAYVPYFMRGTHGRTVDILQAVCGNAYRRGFFDATALEHVPGACFTTDDMWISGYLAFEKDLPRYIIPQRGYDPVQTEWKARDTSPFSLSTVNSANNQDIKCIEGMEEKYGRQWRTAGE